MRPKGFRRPFRVRLGAFRSNGGGVSELERPFGKIHVVARHVTDGSFAEGKPATPDFGEIIGAVVARRNWAEPEVPMQPFRKRDVLALFLILVPRLVDEDMDFGDGADRAALHQFHYPAIVVAGVDLRAHLRDAFVLGRGLRRNRTSSAECMLGFSQ